MADKGTNVAGVLTGNVHGEEKVLLNLRRISVLVGITLAILTPYWWLVDAGSDDLLFIRQTNSLLQGNWLGDFALGANLKLPGFALFLMSLHILMIPYHLGVWAISFLSSLVFWKFSKVHVDDSRVGTILFSGLVLNPINFGAGNARILRDVLYANLFILLIGLILILACSTTKSKYYKLNIYESLFIVTVCFLSILREERIFILGIVLVLGACVIIFSRYSKKKNIARISLVLSLSFISTFFVDVIIQNVNERFYSDKTTALVNPGPLFELMINLQRIHPNSNQSLVWVSEEQREIAYRASSLLENKKSEIEAALNFYHNVSCGSIKVCDDVAGGFLPWAIFYGLTSDASLRDPENYYAYLKNINVQLELFCSNSINCEGKSVNFTGVAPRVGIADLIYTSAKLITPSLRLSSAYGTVGNSEGNGSNSLEFQRVLSHQEPPIEFSGQITTSPRDFAITATILFLLFASVIFLLGLRSKKRHASSFGPLYLALTLVTSFFMARTLFLGVHNLVIGPTISTNYQSLSDSLIWLFYILLISVLLKFLKRAIKTH